MDKEQIKIEPPIVVKEELEIDRNEYFEVKLENEEKPQPVEGFTSEKNKQLISGSGNEDGSAYKMKVEENVKERISLRFEESLFSLEKFFTCCYCGETQRQTKMTPIPQKLEEFKKWSRFIGGMSFTDLPKNSMACRSHFIDEYGDSRLVDVVRWNQIVNTRISETKTCCYCTKTRVVRSMTSVPRDEQMIGKWAEILGKRFLDNTRIYVNSFICRSHFAVGWFGNRPTHILPVADDCGSLVEKQYKELLLVTPKKKISENSSVPVKIRCDYCGESKSYCDLTLISRNPSTLNELDQIYGTEFFRRTLSKKATYICQYHFNVKLTTSRNEGKPFQVRKEAYNLLVSEIDKSFVPRENIGEIRKVKLKEPTIEGCSYKSLYKCERPIITGQHKLYIQDRPSDPKKVKLEVKEEIG